MILSREDILSVDDIFSKLAKVEVPEWGGTVMVRTMSGREREVFETVLTAKKADGNLRALLASLTICDEQGKPLFTEKDISILGEKSSNALHRVYNVAMKLNALSKDSVEELEKNSERATSGATPSESLDETAGSTSTGS